MHCHVVVIGSLFYPMLVWCVLSCHGRFCVLSCCRLLCVVTIYCSVHCFCHGKFVVHYHTSAQPTVYPKVSFCALSQQTCCRAQFTVYN